MGVKLQCPNCQGRGCSLCNGTGYLDEDLVRTVIGESPVGNPNHQNKSFLALVRKFLEEPRDFLWIVKHRREEK